MQNILRIVEWTSTNKFSTRNQIILRRHQSNTDGAVSSWNLSALWLPWPVCCLAMATGTYKTSNNGDGTSRKKTHFFFCDEMFIVAVVTLVKCWKVLLRRSIYEWIMERMLVLCEIVEAHKVCLCLVNKLKSRKANASVTCFNFRHRFEFREVE